MATRIGWYPPEVTAAPAGRFMCQLAFQPEQEPTAEGRQQRDEHLIKRGRSEHSILSRFFSAFGLCLRIAQFQITGQSEAGQQKKER